MPKLTDLPLQAAAKIQQSVGKYAERGSAKLHSLLKMFSAGAFKLEPPQNIAAMVADIGDVAIALAMDDRLIGAARLQIAGSNQLHVERFGRRADHLLLRLSARASEKIDRAPGCEFEAIAHVPPRLFKTNLRWLGAR